MTERRRPSEAKGEAADLGRRPERRRRPAAVLVVGVGSELRTDDAAGRRVAEAVAAHELADVEVRSTHQLTPELAAELGERGLVVFVDASTDVDEVTVCEVAGDGAGEPLTHHLDPAALLALAAGLGWGPAAAVTVRIPVRDLGFGMELDRRTAAACERATEAILDLCRRTHA